MSNNPKQSIAESSNLVSTLREKVKAMRVESWPDGYSSAAAGLEVLALEGAAEIERLTEELDTHLKVHLGVVRENVRLRAALAVIEAVGGMTAANIAREALRGADETTATPGAAVSGEASVASTAEASRPRGLPPETDVGK